MATITGATSHYNKRIDELVVANDATMTMDKAYITKENGADAKDDIADVASKTEVPLTVTRIEEDNYLVKVEGTLTNATDLDRIYIVNSSGKTLLVLDYNLVTGVTDVYEQFNYQNQPDCNEVK
jgi:hypothetical protein